MANQIAKRDANYRPAMVGQDESTSEIRVIKTNSNGELLVTGSATIANDTSTQRVIVSKAGVIVGTREQINLIEGSNISLIVADNPGSNRVDITVANSGGGTGDVVGPASATDNAIARFDSTTGKLIQNSAVTIADTTGVIAGTQGVTLSGSSSGTLAVKSAAVSGSNTLTLPAGTTDFSATGGASQVVKQTSAGGAFTVAQLAASDLSNGTTGSNAVVLATSPTFTTPAAFTTGGTITLAENTSIALDPAGSADGKFTGLTVTATAGYTQAFGDLVYIDPTDSRWEATDANSAAGADGDARGILGMVVVAGTDGNPCTILLNGIIRADAKFPTFTVNNPIYVSETAGLVTQTQPTTTDVVIRVVGTALTADEMYFNPSPDYITHT